MNLMLRSVVSSPTRRPPTKVSRALERMTPERFQVLKTPLPIYSEETEQKHDWVLRVYMDFYLYAELQDNPQYRRAADDDQDPGLELLLFSSPVRRNKTTSNNNNFLFSDDEEEQNKKKYDYDHHDDDDVNKQTNNSSKQRGGGDEDHIALCKQLLFPLNIDRACLFVRFCGLDAGYSEDSIRNTIIPTLKHFHREATLKELPEKDRKALAKALSDVKRSKRECASLQQSSEQEEEVLQQQLNQQQRSTTTERRPAILKDVIRIIEAIPDEHPCKARDASLFLTALYTGARAITCSNVRLGDILNYITLQEHHSEEELTEIIRHGNETEEAAAGEEPSSNSNNNNTTSKVVVVQVRN